MKNYVYSAINNAFYPLELEDLYKSSGSWPTDGQGVTEEVFLEFTNVPPDGKLRAANKTGEPCWVDIPPLSKEELIESAEIKKKQLIDNANSYINTKQWPSKLALGRLSDADKIEFNRYLDYIEALEAIDTSTALDITFPVL